MKFTEKALDELHRDLRDLENKKEQEKQNRQNIIERIPHIIKFCVEGIIKKPSGFFTLKCPKCKGKLETTKIYQFGCGCNYRIPVVHTYYVCANENCEYEYVVEKTRS